MSVFDTEIGWDLVPFAAELDLDRCLLQQWNAKKCTRDEKLHICAVGACMQFESQNTKQTNKKKTPNYHFWRVGSKNKVTGVKARYYACSLQSTPWKGWARHLNHLTSLTPDHISVLTPHKEATQQPPQGASHRFVTWLCSPMLWQGPQWRLVWISNLIRLEKKSGQFLLTGEGQARCLVSIWLDEGSATWRNKLNMSGSKDQHSQI